MTRSLRRNGIHVGALHRRARRDDLALGADGRAFRVLRLLGEPGHADRSIDIAGPDVVTLPGEAIEPLEDLARLVAGFLAAAHRDPVAARRDVDPKPVLDQRQMLVVLAEER